MNLVKLQDTNQYTEISCISIYWCWEGLGAGREGNDIGWDGWMASPTQWPWVWVNSGSWWWTGRPGVLRFMGLQSVGHDWETELNWTDCCWINVVIGERRAWGFPFCHLADVPENNLINSRLFTYDGESILIRYFNFSFVTFIYQRLETQGGNSWPSKLWSRSSKCFFL